MKTLHEIRLAVDEYIGSKGEDGLVDMLNVIERSCWETAEHVRSNWQDEKLAKAWERVAMKLADTSL